jgi:hypothetical protein
MPAEPGNAICEYNSVFEKLQFYVLLKIFQPFTITPRELSGYMRLRLLEKQKE